jgi:diguanylate cyclase (GGDEF)-like protein
VDALTGLSTGSEFEKLLAEILAGLGDGPQAGLCIAYVTLDRFRHLNRWLGFPAGDQALQEIAGRLLDRRLARGPGERPMAARAGGDEFVLALRLDERESVEGCIREMLERLRGPMEIGSQQVYLTASIGFLAAGRHDADAHALIQSAAAAAAKARASGGNASHHAKCCETPNADERYELIHDLRQAVRNSELLLRFQPQVDRACKLDGFEVLLAWQHPKLGPVDAELFIRLAEESGVINELGEWVLRQTCLQLARWRSQGLECPKVAVNVSPIQFASSEFVEIVRGILEESGVGGSSLQFEITENAVLRDMEESVERMATLRELGITFAIDDFGMGYSPLTYLHRLPVDTVKVARTFTGAITHSGGSLPLVHTITVLAHQRGLKVVAEGVETSVEMNMVRAARCDRMQGFLFGLPLPAEEVAPLLQNDDALGPKGGQPLEEQLF